MAVDIKGNNPTSTLGKVFRRSVWIWNPMVNFLEIKYSDIIPNIGDFYFNNNITIQQEKSYKLSQLIKNDLNQGSIHSYIQSFNDYKDSLHDIDCVFCHGTGWETRNIFYQTTRPCFRCEGSKKMRPLICDYFVDDHDFRVFSQFLQHCGGFTIS